MNVIETGDNNIAIVVVCNKKLPTITGDWLRVHNIITEIEWEFFNNNRTKSIVLPNYSRFITDKFTIDINERRLQIMTSDISLIDRMRDLTLAILSLWRGVTVNAIGINAVKRITFVSAKDGYEFGAKFVTLDAFKVFMKEPRVRSFVIENQKDPEPNVPKKTITISSVSKRDVDGEQIPVVEISINNHFQIFVQEEVQGIMSEIEWPLGEFESGCINLCNNV